MITLVAAKEFKLRYQVSETLTCGISPVMVTETKLFNSNSSITDSGYMHG